MIASGNRIQIIKSSFFLFLLLPIFTQFLYHFMIHCSYIHRSKQSSSTQTVYFHYYHFYNEYLCVYIYIPISRLFNATHSNRLPKFPSREPFRGGLNLRNKTVIMEELDPIPRIIERTIQVFYKLSPRLFIPRYTGGIAGEIKIEYSYPRIWKRKRASVARIV